MTRRNLSLWTGALPQTLLGKRSPEGTLGSIAMIVEPHATARR